MQANAITFQPELPPAKLAALKRVKMGNAAKIMCTFKKQFWPSHLYNVVRGVGVVVVCVCGGGVYLCVLRANRV